jgi:hypothetical protein
LIGDFNPRAYASVEKREPSVSHPTRPQQIDACLPIFPTISIPRCHMSQRYQLTANPNAKHTAVALSNRPGISRPASRTSSRASSRSHTVQASANGYTNGSNKHLSVGEEDDFSDLASELDGMGDRRPTLHRPMDGRSHQPLLHKDDEERGRPGYDTSPDRPPLFSRRSTMRSRSPDTQAKLATRKKYMYAAFFLGLSLISFVVQTETAVYIQHELGWNKAYCML